MPMPPEHYPPNWADFSMAIRFNRAQGRCECHGQCGMHTPNPHPRRCVERHHQKAVWFKGTVRLTVAHLCRCDPICLDPMHVIAACQRCHLRIDRFKHAANRLAHQIPRIDAHTDSRRIIAERAELLYGKTQEREPEPT